MPGQNSHTSSYATGPVEAYHSQLKTQYWVEHSVSRNSGLTFHDTTVGDRL